VLVMNKKDAAARKHVFFINADREYREGKAQNFLRPEDISKMVHAYRERKNVEGYARLVPVKEIEAEEYNCNIRRYVDNAPPPELHDVRAHLHGGVPVVEIDALHHYWKNYAGLRERVFVPRSSGSLSHRERAGVRGEDPASCKHPKILVPRELLRLSRTLRQESTDAETLMWQLLRGRQIAGAKFRRQHPFEPYVLDFYCHELKLAVEVDGGQHNEPAGRVHDAR
jgi:hypothetical protein